MASDGGGKIKSKRNQTSNKPYDRNSSLFGKFKSSVKDLLIPSWLLGSSPESDKQASSSQDAQASTSLPQLSTTGNSGNSNLSFGSTSDPTGVQHRLGGGMNTVEQTSQFIDLTQDHSEQGVPGFSGHGQGANSLIGEPYMDSSYGGRVPNVNIATLDRQAGDWRSKKADRPATTKMPSAPAVPRESQGSKEDSMRLRMSDSYLEDTGDEIDEPIPVRPIMVSTGSLNRSSSSSQPASKKQRLWSPETARQGRPLVPPARERPAFNSVLFGSPNMIYYVGLDFGNSVRICDPQSDTMFGESFRESTFYSGKTRFGGAASERRASLNTSLPYQSSLPLRKQVKANTPNSSFNATTSATAQRILETLDKMSTPLGDAKKIPQANESANDSILSFTPSSYRRSSLLGIGRPSSRPLQLPSRGPPTSRHQALTQAVIAKNRQKAGVVDRRKPLLGRGGESEEESEASSSGLQVSQEPAAVREITGSGPPVSQGGQTSSAQPSGGMGKMKTKRFSQHISSGRGTEEDEVVEVPNLRTDFTLPIANINPISLMSQPIKSHTVAAASIPSSQDKSVPLKFTFSTPIEEKKRPLNSKMPHPSEKGFKFSFPLQASQTKTSAAGAEEGSKSSPEPAVGASSGVSLGGSSAAFSAPVPAWGSTAPKPKVASPDIGGTSSSFKSYNKWGGFGKSSDSSAASDAPAGFSLAPAASLKTGSVMDILGGGKSSAPPPATDDLMAKFKKAPGTWECDACMLANKPEATKCVACETPKPGSKQTSAGAPKTSTPATISTTAPPATDDLMAKFKKAPGSWECDACMLANKPEATKCVACETPKPGAKQQQSSSASSNNNSLSTMFKKPPGNWDCDTCMVQNSATATRCIACESPKPGLQAAGIVSKPPVTSSGPSAITVLPTGGFVVSVAATTTGSGGFKFGNSVTSSTPSTSPPAPTGFVFGQTSSGKDSTSQPSQGSSSTAPLTGGFKFGATSTTSSSGGTTSGTSGFGSSNAGSGFVFGSTTTTLPAKSTDNSSGFKFGATVESSKNSDSSSDKPNVAHSGQSGSLSNGSSAPDLNKSNNFGALGNAGFQFGSASSVSNPTVSASSGVKQAFSGFDSSKDNATKPQPPLQQVNFNFNPSSSISPPSAFMTTPLQPQSSEKSDSVAPKPASGLFQFGTPVDGAQTSNAGLGMGRSLSDNKHMVNGGFGSSSEVQSVKDSSRPAQDASKPTGGFNFGSSAPVFGSAVQASSSLFPSPSSTQNAQPGKRSVDFSDSGAPSAKKSVNFGGSNNGEPSANGYFGFGGSSETKAPAFGSAAPSPSPAGGFVFGSASKPAAPQTQTPGPAPGGGFQIPQGSANPTPAASPAFGFSFQTPNDSAGNKGLSMSMTPNFNFGGMAQPSSNTPFQFGAKPAENSTPAPASGLFAFGGTPTPGSSSDGAGFAAGSTGIGSFSVGNSADPGSRIKKKAVRRLKR